METFSITYKLEVPDGEQVEAKVEKICLEQSAELPRSLLDEALAKRIAGNPSDPQQIDEQTYFVTIDWPLENTAGEVTNFLNILYGNISLQPGIQITGASWEHLSTLFPGPALGIEGIRKRLGIPKRALSSTALKPMGLDAESLAGLCYKFARGGIDIIKDDHGLTAQSYAPFKDRVKACVEAVRKAADEAGRRSWYFPNITASESAAVDRYKLAADYGADGVLICPHITGLSTLSKLAELPTDLPVMAHPAFSGSLTTVQGRGFTPDFLYGQLWRALGADCVIYPNTGGRFSFTEAECQAINNSARTYSQFKTSFPVPAGGLQLDNLERWLETYGPETIFLMGGGLYSHEDGIGQAARVFHNILNQE